MIPSFFVNALQVDFASVFAMEHTGMVRMFNTLEEIGLKGFLEASGSVYEGAVVEFFSNAKVDTGTILSFIANRKLALTKDVFAKAFGLPTEVAPSKKKEMKMEYRMLHDIVAKALCGKAGSFDVVTSVKFDLMVAISAGLKLTRHRFCSRIWSKQSLESVKLHPQKVLNSKSLAQLTNSPPDKQTLQGQEHQNPKPTAKGQVEEIGRTVESFNETDVVTSQYHQAQGNEQQAQGEELQAQGDEQQAHREPTTETDRRLSNGLKLVLPYQVQVVIVVYTANGEDNNRIAHEESSAQAGPQHVIISEPQADIDADIKLKEVQKVIDSLDSKVHSRDSRVVSLDSKFEELLNIQTFMKHDIGIYKHVFHEKMDTVAANVASSQTSLETSLVHQFTEHRLQIASDLDFVKLQLAELVNHLKEVGDAKKGEGSSKGPGPNIKKRRMF
ncbi:hypothetical protein F511_27585 [Dorcoceras hygrometricum]|uniref:Uncharacterized protein n=1 Tax=Dorcoceras hygrometricum TaxID=472368 RepID=A0A2Z7C293_9LAMI|nr:hypothetical protein F511_27585 [Dorcoceras hygrometricum]